MDLNEANCKKWFQATWFDTWCTGPLKNKVPFNKMFGWVGDYNGFTLKHACSKTCDQEFFCSNDTACSDGKKCTKSGGSNFGVCRFDGTVCHTVSGSDPNQPCKFPFTYQGVIHNKCTLQNESQFWCATQTSGSWKMDGLDGLEWVVSWGYFWVTPCCKSQTYFMRYGLGFL